MIEAGKRFRHLVQFLSGEPTSDFVYTLYDQSGAVVTTATVTLAAGSLSYIIEISPAQNTLNNPLYEKMSLEWSYDTATSTVDDSLSYVIYAPIPFAVSVDGVRGMLGVDSDELPDDEINLLSAYAQFRDKVGDDTDLSQWENTGSYDSLRITRAIEAYAGLLIFPTLQLRLPKKYDSGTSSYERWNSIDWEALRTLLDDAVNDGILVVDPAYEPFPIIDIFSLSDRDTDPITGV